MNLVKVRYIFCCFVSLILVGCFSPSNPPADKTLIEIFNNQQNKFETLANMLLDDTDLQKVTSNYVLPEGAKISNQRLQEYRQLLKEVNLHSVERSKEAVFLTAYVSGGLSDDGIYKGYVYFQNGIPRESEALMIDNLDGLEWNPNQVLEFYRKIDEKWYLWFLA